MTVPVIVMVVIVAEFLGWWGFDHMEGKRYRRFE